MADCPVHRHTLTREAKLLSILQISHTLSEISIKLLVQFFLKYDAISTPSFCLLFFIGGPRVAIVDFDGPPPPSTTAFSRARSFAKCQSSCSDRMVSSLSLSTSLGRTTIGRHDRHRGHSQVSVRVDEPPISSGRVGHSCSPHPTRIEAAASCEMLASNVSRVRFRLGKGDTSAPPDLKKSSIPCCPDSITSSPVNAREMFMIFMAVLLPPAALAASVPWSSFHNFIAAQCITSPLRSRTNGNTACFERDALSPANCISHT